MSFSAESGGVFGWGNHEYGQLGVKFQEPHFASPQTVLAQEMDGSVTGIAAGGPFTAFLTGTCAASLQTFGVSFLSSPPPHRARKCVHSRFLAYWEQ